MSVWFVTGASRGFGVEIVRTALAEGHQVVATSRNADTIRAAFPDAGDALLPVTLDVTDPAAITAAVNTALTAFERIDVLVNNAGHGLLSAVEESTDQDIRAVYETNVFGVLNVLRGVLPVLRRQRSGHVINISSVGGFSASEGWGVYCSTKFAMEGYSEALAIELAPLGVQVTVVEPGYFRTDFLDTRSLTTGKVVIDDYAETSGAMRTTAVHVNHAQLGDPAKGAEAIVKIAGAPNAPLRLPLGSDCVRAIEAKLAHVTAELDDWRRLALSTDFA
jgi:NAD(P)-dependent dehydrogenase (short-subunit alcohol dehydrogenase family)